MCVNIGTHKTINFSFGTNGKLMVLGIPILKQNIGMHKTINFPFGTNGKLMGLSITILSHIRVVCKLKSHSIWKSLCLIFD